MFRLQRPFFWLLLLGLMVLWPGDVARAQRTVTDDEVNAVARELYCPVCESTPLDVCATQACADWRAVIRTKLEEGQSPEQIKAYFADQYGTRVLAAPPTSGFSLVVWLLPLLAVLVGGFAFWRYLRTLSQPAASTPTPTPVATGDDPYVRRIEEELNEIS